MCLASLVYLVSLVFRVSRVRCLFDLTHFAFGFCFGLLLCSLPALAFLVFLAFLMVLCVFSVVLHFALLSNGADVNRDTRCARILRQTIKRTKRHFFGENDDGRDGRRLYALSFVFILICSLSVHCAVVLLFCFVVASLFYSSVPSFLCYFPFVLIVLVSQNVSGLLRSHVLFLKWFVVLVSPRRSRAGLAALLSTVRSRTARFCQPFNIIVEKQNRENRENRS